MPETNADPQPPEPPPTPSADATDTPAAAVPDAADATLDAAPGVLDSAIDPTVPDALADTFDDTSFVASDDPSADTLGGEFAPPDGVGAYAPLDLDFQRILSIEVPVIVQLAVRKLTVSEVMRLGAGAIIEFTKPADDPLDLLANNKMIGKGNTVKVGENFGLKITSIGTAQQTIASLAG